MNICCLLLVANYVGRVLYANNVGQLLYVVFAPPAVSAQRIDCTAPQLLRVSKFIRFYFVYWQTYHVNPIEILQPPAIILKLFSTAII